MRSHRWKEVGPVSTAYTFHSKDPLGRQLIKQTRRLVKVSLWKCDVCGSMVVSHRMPQPGMKNHPPEWRKVVCHDDVRKIWKPTGILADCKQLLLDKVMGS